MKNIFKTTLLIITTGSLLCGCDALEQRSKSTYEDNTVFGNYTLARYAVNGIYESYITMASYRTDYFEYFGANTDVEMRMSANDTENNNYCQYKMNPTNSYFNRPDENYIFSGNFKGIERANLCINGLKEFGNIDTDPQMGALYGEALTARALLYADLLNIFGEVPARFEPIKQETTYLPKADKDVIYKQLLGDLEEAARYLDYNSQVLLTQPGKACANGMYARLALQAAGYSCRPDEGKVNTGSLGTVRKTNDPELQASVLYPKALAALEDIIENANLDLFENFEDIWRFYCSKGTAYGTAENPEIIFGLPFSDTRGQHLTRNAVRNAKYNKTSNPRIGVSGALYFKYDKEDTRRYVTCIPCSYNDKGQADGSSISPAVWSCGKWRVDWRTDSDYLMKDNNVEDGCKFTYLRYADILLMAAEIANELEDLTKAKQYMRPVLVRAYQDETLADNYLSRLTDKESFFDAIKDQRAFEFAGECLRRSDLIRWGILKETLDEAKTDLQNMKDLTGNFSVYPNVIYWRLKDNGIDAEFHGFNPGETDVPVDDENGKWTKRSFFSTINQNAIDNLYLADPDMNMYRPIPAAIITANMGALKNDYGYTF